MKIHEHITDAVTCEGPAARDPNLWVSAKITGKMEYGGKVFKNGVHPNFRQIFPPAQVPRKFALELGYKK